MYAVGGSVELTLTFPEALENERRQNDEEDGLRCDLERTSRLERSPSIGQRAKRRTGYDQRDSEGNLQAAGDPVHDRSDDHQTDARAHEHGDETLVLGAGALGVRLALSDDGEYVEPDLASDHLRLAEVGTEPFPNRLGIVR